MSTPRPAGKRRSGSFRPRPPEVALGLTVVLVAGVLGIRSVHGAGAGDPDVVLRVEPQAAPDGSSGTAPLSSAFPVPQPAPAGSGGVPSRAPSAGGAVPRATLGTSPQGPQADAPRPGRVLFATGRATPQERGPEPGLVVLTALPDGTERSGRPAAPAFPLGQVSGTLVATTQVLSDPSRTAPLEQGIALLDTRTHVQRVVTRHGYDDAPVWSPDGRALAYRSRVEDADGTQRGAVRLLSRTGKDAGTVLLPPQGQSDGPPVWSPDGTQLATVRTRATPRGPLSRVVLLGLHAKAPRVLADGEYTDLAWSPDGGTLAAVRADGGARSDLWIVDVAGRGAKRVTAFAAPGRGVARATFCGQTAPAVPRVSEPVWSRDGRRLAYLSSYPHVAQFARQADVEVVTVASHRYTTAYATPKATCSHDKARYTRTQLYGWVG